MDFLSNITVLDFTHVLAGPYCTMMLADYGADVIKIERPGVGDDTRAWGPPFAGGESCYFISVNRNKRSLALDLKSAEGKKIVRELAQQSDVVIENFSPGTMQRLGFAYEDIKTLNPRAIYASLSGYGQTGPDRDLPGFDVVIQARGGMMSLTGPAQGEPSIVGISIVDIFAGLHALTGILAALQGRAKSGHGCYLDISLLDSQVNILTHQATSYLMTGRVPSRRGNSHNNIVPYQTFKTKTCHINVAAGNDKLYRNFCAALGRADLADDPRFASNGKRVENRTILCPILEGILAEFDGRELVARLSAAHVPAAVVQDMKAVFDDPQVQARQAVAEMAHPTAGTLRVPHAAGFVDGEKPKLRRPPPLLGEHTAELLKEKLGYDDAKIAALREAKAIGG
ncbi:MAG: CoA transferase [Planctomycetes bacterium]|nr:CoA transferase [Planctomycetota bacterium]